MTDTPDDDKPGFVTEKPEHCHALSWPKNPSVQEYAGSSSITHLEYRPEGDILTTNSVHGSHSPLTKDNTPGTIMATAPLRER
jgi:hypothetical protein